MVNAAQIREIVAKFLSDALDMKAFVLEFSSLSYNILKNGSPDAVQLANAVESKLADVRGGYISPSVFRASLRRVVEDSIAAVANNWYSAPQFGQMINHPAAVEKAFAVEPSGTSTAVGFGSVLLVQQ